MPFQPKLPGDVADFARGICQARTTDRRKIS